MVVSARDLPAARWRRWTVHGILGLTLLAACGWAWSSHAEVRRLEAGREAALGRIPAEEADADAVARECGLRRFSDPESLKRFPMKISRFPSREEARCGEEVTRTRSALIETYLELDRLRPVLEKARATASPSIPTALALAAVLAVWLWISELRHRKGGRA